MLSHFGPIFERFHLGIATLPLSKKLHSKDSTTVFINLSRHLWCFPLKCAKLERHCDFSFLIQFCHKCFHLLQLYIKHLFVHSRFAILHVQCLSYQAVYELKFLALEIHNEAYIMTTRIPN